MTENLNVSRVGEKIVPHNVSHEQNFKSCIQIFRNRFWKTLNILEGRGKTVTSNKIYHFQSDPKS
jgi:hypothetical protein